MDNVVFIVSEYKHLPTKCYSRIWCWQYRVRRAIARKAHMMIYRARKRLNRPKLHI